VITEEDCGTLRGIATTALKDNEDVIEPLSDRIEGRTSLHDVYDLQSDELLVTGGDEITTEIAKKIEEAGVEIVEIRSVLTCESKRGVCVKCYGKNLAAGALAQKGDAVGIIEQ
jgi:DNA-directed RNA polymerase subunit beta'